MMWSGLVLSNKVFMVVGFSDDNLKTSTCNGGIRKFECCEILRYDRCEFNFIFLSNISVKLYSSFSYFSSFYANN